MRRVITRLSATAALVAVVVAVVGSGSASAQFAICTGSGKLYVTNPGGPLQKAKWTLFGNGQCDTPVEVKTMNLKGAGTSTSLGLCTPSHLLVENLKLGVTVTTTGVTSGNVRKQRQVWSSPLTVFPLATPFVISTGGAPAGGGVMFSHINLMCGNGGNSPSATFTWTTLR